MREGDGEGDSRASGNEMKDGGGGKDKEAHSISDTGTRLHIISL